MLGDALKQIRVFHDMTQAELAEELGLSNTYISELERSTREPSLSVINLYATFFDIPASSILFFSENLHDDSYASRANRLVSKKILSIMRFLARQKEGNEA